MYDVPKNPQVGDQWAPIVLSSRQRELVSEAEAALKRAGLHFYLNLLHGQREFEERPYTFLNGCWQRKDNNGVGFIAADGRCAGFDSMVSELSEPPRSFHFLPSTLD